MSAQADAADGWSSDREKCLAEALAAAITEMNWLTKRQAAADESRDDRLREGLARMASSCLPLEQVERLARDLARHAKSIRDVQRLIEESSRAEGGTSVGATS